MRAAVEVSVGLLKSNKAAEAEHSVVEALLSGRTVFVTFATEAGPLPCIVIRPTKLDVKAIE